MSNGLLFSIGAIVFLLGALGVVLAALDSMHRWDERGDNYARSGTFSGTGDAGPTGRERR
ncbi:MAG: hypothetical protein R3343_12115 [Nitriliruptorales bacterium]|nr:hypothetical protein [Nitriliruptorales bacterium]